jgi:hypothetical protein
MKYSTTKIRCRIVHLIARARNSDLEAESCEQAECSITDRNMPADCANIGYRSGDQRQRPTLLIVLINFLLV